MKLFTTCYIPFEDFFEFIKNPGVYKFDKDVYFISAFRRKELYFDLLLNIDKIYFKKINDEAIYAYIK